MAFTVEDGTGLANANSYITVADADTYFSDHNLTAWTALAVDEKQAGLLYATAYVDAQYNFPGSLKTANQALDWPRSNAYDYEDRLYEGLPQKLLDAVCELALIHNNTEAVNATFDRGGNIKREKVGSLEVEYESGAPAGVTYPHIDNILASITTSGGPGTVELIRA